MPLQVRRLVSGLLYGYVFLCNCVGPWVVLRVHSGRVFLDVLVTCAHESFCLWSCLGEQYHDHPGLSLHHSHLDPSLVQCFSNLPC